MLNEFLLAPGARQLLAQVRKWNEHSFYGKKCWFPFGDIPNSKRLRYELTNWENYATYLDLFQNDDSLSVDKRFKDEALLDEYAVWLLEIMYYDIKRCGCDWILKLHSGEPIGVLHLYHLNREMIGGQYFPCSIGYGLAAPFRKQGYAHEALSHLLHHIKTIFNRSEVNAYTHQNNQDSIRLLQKSGFQLVHPDFTDSDDQMLTFSKKLA